MQCLHIVECLHVVQCVIVPYALTSHMTDNTACDLSLNAAVSTIVTLCETNDMATRSKGKSSLVYQFYTNMTVHDSNQEGQCTFCKKKIKGKAEISSNFIIHLKRAHKKEYELSYKRPTTEKQLTIDQPWHESSNAEKITDSVAGMVVCDLQPASIVEKKGFRHLMHVMDPSYTMVSRQALQYSLLPKKANECYSLIVSALENVEWVSITLDIWTSQRMHSYLGVTAHFISTGWDLQMYLLSCTQILGRHTASNITSELQEVLIKYRIEDKIFTAVTDNASNMKKAFNYRETISLYDEDVHECDDMQGIDLVEEPPSEEEDNDNNANDNQSIDSNSPIEDELYIN